jgi:hypothetical protein
MADAKNNPLNDFASSSAGTNDIRITPFPKLSDHVNEHGFSDGMTKWDEKMEEIRQSLEKTLNERISGKQPADISKSGT